MIYYQAFWLDGKDWRLSACYKNINFHLYQEGHPSILLYPDQHWDTLSRVLAEHQGTLRRLPTGEIQFGFLDESSYTQFVLTWEN